MEGSANGACDCYTLTNTTNQAGAIWSPNSIDLTNPFDFTFEVNLGCNDVWGADGMMFVLQQNGTGTGDIGNGIGYGDYVGNPNPISTNSIGIEIDTWDSNPAVPTDIASDHIAMSSGGGNDHDVIAPIAIPNIEDCAPHNFQVTWDPVGQNLEVLLDGTSIFIYNGDIVTNFFGGNPNVFFGWTGGTGGVMNVQSVCMYRNAAFTPDQTTVCENQTVTFTDNSTSDLNMITNWIWNFGDGNTSTLQNPTHSYTTAGVYNVQLTITDISGCTDVVNQNITVTPGLNLNMTFTDVLCFGANDGTVTATPTNGTGPYNYIWDDPGTQTTQTATGLGPNTYNVNVTDANGCAGTGNVMVSEPTQLVLDSAVAVDATCGVNNGTITFYPNNGTPAYQYSIDGGAIFQAGAVFNSLAPNTYNLELQDANGCSVTTTLTVNNNSAMVLDSLVVTDENCGQSDGTVTAYVTSGLPPYQYSIDGGTTYQASNVFTGLAANNYTIQVLDGNNCIVTGIAVVNAPTTLQIDNMILTDPSCNGFADGQIDVVASGGAMPFQYSVDNGVTFQAGTNFTGLTGGLYQVVVEDATGCQVQGLSNLVDPVPVVINSAIPTDVSCTGSTDGQIDITASGGVPGYTYSVDGGATFQAGNVFSNLIPNTYNIQVNDANNCSATTTATVGEPLPIIIDSIVVVDVTCNGLADGGISIYANQGTPVYQYSIDGGTTFQAGNAFVGLAAGTVNVDVIDANGCATTGSALISESQPLIVSALNDTTICIGGTTNLCPTLQGGTGPFTYQWNGALGTACLNATTPGVYSYQVIDANNCTSNIESVEVFQNPPISLVLSPDAIVCPGDVITLTAEAVGGDGGPYTYNWVNQNDLSTSTGAVQNFTIDQNTTFSIGVTDGCETPAAVGNINVTVHNVPAIVITADNYDGCEPVPVNFTNSTDPTLLVSTNWDLGNGDTFSGNGTTVSTNYDTPGCYDVFAQITTVNGCVSDTTFVDMICVYQVPTADFDCNPENPDIIESQVQFGNTSENATAYSWTFGDGNSSVETNPINVYPEVGYQTYQVQLIALTPFGCADTATKYITVDEIPLFYAPNAATPNSDSHNPSWAPVFIPGFSPLGYSCKIFNRWGDLMFETQDYNVGWDCTFDGVIVPDGVYVWQITFRENATDIVHRHFGHITVLK